MGTGTVSGPDADETERVPHFRNGACPIFGTFSRSDSSRIISAGPRGSSDGSIPRSTRNGPAMRVARSSGVTKRRLAQLVPSRARRSPSVFPTGMRRHNHPLRPRGVRAAQLGELCHERVAHARRRHAIAVTARWFLRRSRQGPQCAVPAPPVPRAHRRTEWQLLLSSRPGTPLHELPRCSCATRARRHPPVGPARPIAKSRASGSARVAGSRVSTDEPRRERRHRSQPRTVVHLRVSPLDRWSRTIR